MVIYSMKHSCSRSFNKYSFLIERDDTLHRKLENFGLSNIFNPFYRMGCPKIDLLTCIFFIRLFRLLDNEVDYLFFERAKIFIKIALCAKGASYFSILCYCCLFFQLVRRVTTFQNSGFQLVNYPRRLLKPLFCVNFTRFSTTQ